MIVAPRTFAECPKTNVKDVRLMNRSWPHVASSLQDTSMKSSRVHNKVPSSSPWRTLPLQHPQLYNQSRQSLLHQQPVCSSAPSSRGSFSPSINGLHSTPRHRMVPLHRPVGSSGTNSHVPFTSTRNNSTTPKSQTPMSFICSSAPPKVMKDLNSHSTPSHIRNHPTTKSKRTFSYSGSKNVTAQRHESHKQMQDERLASSESPANLNCSSQKRHREYEPCDAKKLCRQGENWQTHRSKPTDVSPSSASPTPSSEHPSRFSTRTPTNQLCGEPLCDANPSIIYKSHESSCPSVLPNVCIKLISNRCIALTGVRPDSDDGWLTEFLNRNRDHCLKAETSFSIRNSQEVVGNSQQLGLSSCISGPPQQNTSVLSARCSSEANVVEEEPCTRPKTTSKPNSASGSCAPSKWRRSSSTRRCSELFDDISDLFTPDPLTYKDPVLNGSIKSTSTEAQPSTASSKPVTTSSGKVTGSSDLKVESPDTIFPPQASPMLPLTCSPVVVLHRIHVDTTVGQPDTEAGKSTEKRTLNPDVSACTSEVGPIQNQCPVHCSETPPQENQACEESKQQGSEDPLDVELDVALRLALDLDLVSNSSQGEEEEEETLFSLHDMMNPATQPRDAPEKDPPPEPSTQGYHSESETQPLPLVTKPGTYKNSLDQMLKEKKSIQRAKEIEERLLTACKEDLLKIAEYEKPEEINTEQQEFLQRYSLTCSAIRDVPPGEEVFNLERFGQIFSSDTLKLNTCIGHLKKSIRRALPISSPAQLKMHICVGMFQEVFNSHLPCPSRISQFLFKLMSVHDERMVSEKTLKALCDIACTAAYQIVMKGRENFKVWVPTLADIALVLMNMGAAFNVLFPLESLQPPFTERDVLAEDMIRSESTTNKDQASFPEHNYNNILKYLSYCMTLCPRAYSDEELLLLLTVVNKVSLDARLILQPSVELFPVQYKILYSIRNWAAMLPRICLALTNLTDDHHNMCLLVQLLPHKTRGKHEVLHLRQHLSLSMISKLLDGRRTYRPTAEEFKLSELIPYLPLMRPSLLRARLPNSGSSQKDMATLDQEAYYLCYSLLTLANEASNFQPIFPANQKKEVQLLCSELDTHIKCDIRESGKCLYRSKVKDLVARMYTNWQILLQRTKPLNGKLYDYYLPSDIHNSQEEQDVESSEDGEGPSEREKEVYSEDEQTDEGKDSIEDSEETEDNTVRQT